MYLLINAVNFQKEKSIRLFNWIFCYVSEQHQWMVLNTVLLQQDTANGTFFKFSSSRINFRSNFDLRNANQIKLQDFKIFTALHLILMIPPTRCIIPLTFSPMEILISRTYNNSFPLKMCPAAKIKHRYPKDFDLGSQHSKWINLLWIETLFLSQFMLFCIATNKSDAGV